MVESPIKLRLSGVIEDYAIPLTGENDQYAPLLEMIADADVVMIGEATHGTQEFYQHRADITKRLIIEKGFTAVAAEADWPDAYNINRFVRSAGVDTVKEALSGFQRFPRWMWRNTVVADFARWMRNYNQRQSMPEKQAGFYGLDLYSLDNSMMRVVEILEEIDPKAALLARERYECMDRYRGNFNEYGFASEFGISKSCEDEIVSELIAVREVAFDQMQGADDELAEKLFNMEQNARLVKNAERYYRSIFSSQADSWNLRDHHMAETLAVLMEHLGARKSTPAKVVVWAHNSHIGDARATEFAQREQLNIGQLGRETYENKVALIGFSTYDGTVMAANAWDEPGEVKNVLPALPGSYEELFHHVRYKDYYVLLHKNEVLRHYFNSNLLQRAIGVVYAPQTERMSHYYFARLARQFDAMIHIDNSTALEII